MNVSSCEESYGYFSEAIVISWEAGQKDTKLGDLQIIFYLCKKD